MFAFIDGPSSNIKPFQRMMLHFQLENVRTIILLQLIHVASYKWQSKSGEFMWVHNSTTHNSPHE